MIIKELQVYLAGRLLAVKDYDTVKEVRMGSSVTPLLNRRFAQWSY